MSSGRPCVSFPVTIPRRLYVRALVDAISVELYVMDNGFTTGRRIGLTLRDALSWPVPSFFVLLDGPPGCPFFLFFSFTCPQKPALLVQAGLLTKLACPKNRAKYSIITLILAHSPFFLGYLLRPCWELSRPAFFFPGITRTTE